MLGMFEPKRHIIGDLAITALGPYSGYKRHLKQGGTWDNFPPLSQRTLNLKNRRLPALNGFHEYLNAKLPADRWDVIAVVPSSDPEKKESGIRDLALRLAASRGYGDATGCLVRHTKIPPLHDGGSRAAGVHVDSMAVADADLIQGQRVLLIDDVMTSGNSLIVGRDKLLAAGAAAVDMLALAKTTY